MQDYKTIKRHPYGRWAISREVTPGKTVYLIERTPVHHESDVAVVLTYLGYPPTIEMTEQFFPKDSQGKHCPTFEVMKFFCERKYQGSGGNDPLRSVGV